MLLKDIFYRLKMLLEGSQYFRFLQSAGVKSKHGFYLANSGVTLILLFFLLSSFFAIFPLQIHGCNTEAFPQPLFHSLDPHLGSDLPHGLMLFFTCLFALQLLVYIVVSSQLTPGPLHSIQEQEERTPMEHH